jgi:hypothetical protein
MIVHTMPRVMRAGLARTVFGSFRCSSCLNSYGPTSAYEHVPGSADCDDARFERDRSQADR